MTVVLTPHPRWNHPVCSVDTYLPIVSESRPHSYYPSWVYPSSIFSGKSPSSLWFLLSRCPELFRKDSLAFWVDPYYLRFLSPPSVLSTPVYPFLKRTTHFLKRRVQIGEVVKGRLRRQPSVKGRGIQDYSPEAHGNTESELKIR